MADDLITTHKKFLQAMPFQQTFRVDRDIQISIEEDFDSFMRNEIKIRLEKWEIVEHLADSHYRERCYFEFPTSTWQMFKKTNENKWWMRWFVKRYPVNTKYETETVTIKVGRYALYPDAPDIRFPKLGMPIKYETINRITRD